MQAVLPKETEMTRWFDDLVATIRKDQLLLETGVASQETKKMYDLFFHADIDQLQKNVRKSSASYFIQRLVMDYIKEVRERGRTPNKLALQLSESRILVWAEIKDDDEDTEDALLLAEAKINAKYGAEGFHVSSTILEESDNYKIPGQFSTVL